MREFVTALFICAIFYLTFAIIFHPYDDGGIGQWFYNYQTLITGLIAIGAAWATISEMQATEEAQKLRHGSEMFVGLRSENLAIRRFEYLLESTKVYQGNIQAFLQAYRDKASQDEVLGKLRWAVMAASVFDHVIRKENTEELRSTLPPELDRALDLYSSAMSMVDRIVGDKSAAGIHDSSDAEASAWLDKNIVVWLDHLDRAFEDFPRLVGEWKSEVTVHLGELKPSPDRG